LLSTTVSLALNQKNLVNFNVVVFAHSDPLNIDSARVFGQL